MATLARRTTGLGTANIGGAGALAVLYGPPVLGLVGGVFLAPKHRVLGGLIGTAVGVGVTMAISAIAARQPAPAPVVQTTLRHNADYLLSSTAQDTYTAAMTAGFTQVVFNSAANSMQGTWGGADGAPVPAGIIAKQ